MIRSMKVPLYQVDAFADMPFTGNPAAVCPLDRWLPDDVMQAIAAENNLSETAFFVGGDGRYALRWFTPASEVDLCGHATLATSHVVFSRLEPTLDEVVYTTRSGDLTVRRDGGGFSMSFPSLTARPAMAPEGLRPALGGVPVMEFRQSRDDWMAVLPDADAVRNCRADFRAIAQLKCRGLIITAKAGEGDGVDFVSRFFAPSVGVNEDPVTGSAHCALAPYWAKRLKKDDLTAAQLSGRGGVLGCRVEGGRVVLSGRAVLVMEGTLHL